MYARFRQWKQLEIFTDIIASLCTDADMENLSIVSTSCKVHQRANGGEKTKNKAVGISKGGRNTKIHVIVDGLGNPISFLLSAGNEHDSKHAIPLLRQVELKGSNILGDRAYNAKEIRDYIIAHQASYTIPPKKNNPNPWTLDCHTYKERHLIECFFQKLNWFRRVFTRYNKLDSSFLAFVMVAAIAILLI